MTKVSLTVVSPETNMFFDMKRLALLCLALSLILAAGCLDMPEKTPVPTPTPSITPASPPVATLVPPRVDLSSPIGEDSPSTARITRSYAWEYGRSEWSLEMQIAENLYSYYKEMPRPPTTNYSVYVTHPLDDADIDYLADQFQDAARQHRFDEVEIIEFAAAFVQNLPYTADSVTTAYDEYPRYPVETLIDNGGDCEDTSILLAAVLDSLGYNVALIVFPDKHCAVGVSVDGVAGAYFEQNGTRYFYLETTDTGWGIGQVPDDLQGLNAYLYEMEPVPILSHRWDGTVAGQVVELAVTVSNLGSGPADGVYILAGFDAGGGRLWNAMESQPFVVEMGQSLEVGLTLRAPLEKHTRIVVQVVYAGSAVDKSYSEWFD